jgi:hypothetical protein
MQIGGTWAAHFVSVREQSTQFRLSIRSPVASLLAIE